MVQRVDHGILSATATTGWETAKGGLKGGFLTGLVGAAIAVGALTAVVAIGGALIPGITAAGSVGALFGAGGGLAAGIGIAATAVTAVAGFFTTGPIGTAVGTLLGVSKGVHRVKDENAAYAHRQDIIRGAVVNQHNQVAQQAYAMGVQHGQQSVVEELQRVHAAMIQDEMAKQAMINKSPVGEHTAKVCNDRAQAAGKQMTV